MVTITLSHYTRGKYFGTDDPSEAWMVFRNGNLVTPEMPQAEAKAIALKLLNKAASPKRLVEWNGDTATEREMLRA